MKAISTRYDGYLFRSRLEARWAVFFNHINLPYEYEIEGYKLNNGKCYLPDFYLPTLHLFAEVKPFQETQEDTEKLLYQFALENKSILLLTGPPAFRGLYDLFCWAFDDGGGGIYDLCAKWCIMTEGQTLSVDYDRESTEFFDDCIGTNKIPIARQDICDDDDENTLRSAVYKAREARFEHRKHLTQRNSMLTL